MQRETWHKSNYKTTQGRWRIAILFTAGYRVVQPAEALPPHCRPLDGRLFLRLPKAEWSRTQPMTEEEIAWFCRGLAIAGRSIRAALGLCEADRLLILLREVQFSVCEIQNEAFCAAALQWAAEVFGFAPPAVPVRFDPGLGRYGQYVYDFAPAEHWAEAAPKAGAIPGAEAAPEAEAAPKTVAAPGAGSKCPGA